MAASKKRKLTNASTPASKKSKQSMELNEYNEEFYIVQASLVLSVPPAFATNPKAGIQEMLDSMVMRYNPVLQGVLVSHSKTTFLTRTAPLLMDCPYAACKVNFEATIWSPQVGMKLGQIKLCSPDHVALLIHRTFNVSIPRDHIPTDLWEFEQEQDGEKAEDGEGRGRWRNKETEEILGGAEGYLEFIVIGVTLANEMLSLHGSLLGDPFSG